MSSFFINIVMGIVRLINCCFPHDKKSVLFIPHLNCLNDNYDIFNYLSDNTLCLFNSMATDSKYKEYSLYLVIFHKSKIEEYYSKSREYNVKDVHFIYYLDRVATLKAALKCGYIFTSSTMWELKYRTRKQITVSLNYFPSPFKDDFYKITEFGGYKKFLKEQKRINNSYDYHLANSELMAKLISMDLLLYYPKFLPLGSPRNDIFFQNCSSIKDKVLELIGIRADRIICYVPTHRDYENKDRIFYDSNSHKKRSIWGELNEGEEDKLEQMLEEKNSIIIAKLHPAQEKDIINLSEKKRIILFSQISQKLGISLQQLMAISDFMIADYSTATYDYIYLNRPIVHYCYDFKKYDETRGFFINPIEPYCAGPIIIDFSDLVVELKSLINGNDAYKAKREFIRDLAIKYKDGNATQRIKDYFFAK